LQARRKNEVLTDLERDSWFRIGVVAQMQEQDFQPKAVRSLLARTIGRAHHTLSDLAPGIPGATGIEQIHWLSRHPTLGPATPDLPRRPPGD